MNFSFTDDNNINNSVAMLPSKRPCKFFSEGRCNRGDACSFSHEARPGITTAGATSPSAVPVTSSRLCTFFLQGRCTHGALCHFHHPQAGTTAQLAARAATGVPQQEVTITPTTSVSREDTRGQIPCKFLTKHGGCQNSACPFLHDPRTPAEVGAVDDDAGDEAYSHEADEDDLMRELAGASVSFGDEGQVLKVSLPTDFSIACLTGFEAGTTSEQLTNMLEPLGLKIPVNCIHVSARTTSQDARATIKVEDPFFAKVLVSSLLARATPLSATIVPNGSRKSQFRKVYISWYKSTRLAWLNFGSGDIARRVSHKFNQSKYTVLQQPVKASEPKHSDSSARWIGRNNHVAWTIVLSNVPGHAQAEDIEHAITAPHDEPRHIEMGRPSHDASEPDVAMYVRKKLEEQGTLESFFLSPVSRGKRCKVMAWFQDESSARAACVLHDKALPILKRGKLTVTLIESAKVKILTSIFSALRNTIEHEAQAWRKEHLSFHVYPGGDNPFTTLKVEGENAAAIKLARKSLDKLLEGTVLVQDGVQIWNPALAGYGTATQAMKTLEREFKVVTKRDKTKRQLRYYGPPDKLDEITSRTAELLKEVPQASWEISLTPEQFSWLLRGGSQILRLALENEVLSFDVVTRMVIINGTHKQYETALAVLNRKPNAQLSIDSALAPQGDCPICLCEAENPVQTSCQHSYCLECFEANCTTAASASKSEFQVRCQGQEGTCPTVFSAREIKKHVSSTAFEDMLRASFEEYLKRHPATFRYCPTPDCGIIYRSTTTSNLEPHTCPTCLEPLCTTCHVVHGAYTCAEYKDIASGGVEALARLKKELNIKDCPRCSTPIEKTDGCNHMTCVGCRVHICWVCMAVFDTDGPCYAHMNRVHGGIGLDDYAYRL